MRTLALGTAAMAAVVMIGSAQAADLNPIPAPVYKAPALVAPVYSWAGFYLGANAGFAGNHECWTNIPTGGAEGCHDGSSFAGGGQMGVNFQNGAFVYGLEAMADWASLSGNNVNAFFAGPTVDSTKVKGLGTMVGRAGYAVNNVLLYANGGAAWNDANRQESVASVVFANQDTLRWGWTVGAGLEYGLTPNLSLGLNYQYMSFTGTVNINCPTCIAVQSPLPESIPQHLNEVTARLNYRFGGF